MEDRLYIFLKKRIGTIGELKKFIENFDDEFPIEILLCDRKTKQPTKTFKKIRMTRVICKRKDGALGYFKLGFALGF